MWRLSVLSCLLACVACTAAPTAREGHCTGRPARPLSKTAVLRALRAQGVQVTAGKTGRTCAALAPGGTTAWEIGRDDFSVDCLLDEHSIYGRRLRSDLHAKPASPVFHGDKATFELANVDCTVYSRDAVAPVQRAFERLERSL